MIPYFNLANGTSEGTLYIRGSDQTSQPLFLVPGSDRLLALQRKVRKQDRMCQLCHVIKGKIPSVTFTAVSPHSVTFKTDWQLLKLHKKP